LHKFTNRERISVSWRRWKVSILDSQTSQEHILPFTLSPRSISFFFNFVHVCTYAEQLSSRYLARL